MSAMALVPMAHPAPTPRGTRPPTSRVLVVRSTTTTVTSSAFFDATIPPALRPLLRAFLLGYASSVGPRLINVLLATLAAQRRRRRRRRQQEQPPREGPCPDDDTDDRRASLATAGRSACRVLCGGLEWRRFPTFCAALVGGSTLLEVPLRRLLARCAPSLSPLLRVRLARWIASFVAAWGGIRFLLQNRPPPAPHATAKMTTDTTPNGTTNTNTPAADDDTAYAGRTLDLTLFAATRAADVVVGTLWARRKDGQAAAAVGRAQPAVEALVGRLADPMLFAASSALVMWAWFYQPARLPRAYTNWITSAAAVDGRLIDALRRCRDGRLHYGADRGDDGRILQGMCRDYGWPAAWGDPAQAVPFPCDMVHMDCGPSCERHAAVRWARSWRWAMAMYLPLSLLTLAVRRLAARPSASAVPSSTALRLRAAGRRAVRDLGGAVLSAARSSAFLATFIMLFFYGVCLTRTRLGPRLAVLLARCARRLGVDRHLASAKLVDNTAATTTDETPSLAVRQAIDGGLCTMAGCGLCGWSILLERASRRKDMGLFVAPRALATLLPRRYARAHQWRETLVFAASTAVVFTAVQENPKRVRGVLGGVLGLVFA